MRWLLGAVVLVLAVVVFWRWADELARQTVPDPAHWDDPGTPPTVHFPVQVVDAAGRPTAGLRLVLGLEPADPSGRTRVVASALTGADGRASVRLPRKRWERLSGSSSLLHLVARFPAKEAPQIAFDPHRCLETGQAVLLRLPPESRLVVELLEASGDRSQRDFRLYAGWRPADSELPSWLRTPEIMVPATAGRAVIACGEGLLFDLWVARADGSGRKPILGAAGPAQPGEELVLQRQLPAWKGPKLPASAETD